MPWWLLAITPGRIRRGRGKLRLRPNIILRIIHILLLSWRQLSFSIASCLVLFPRFFHSRQLGCIALWLFEARRPHAFRRRVRAWPRAAGGLGLLRPSCVGEMWRVCCRAGGICRVALGVFGTKEGRGLLRVIKISGEFHDDVVLAQKLLRWDVALLLRLRLDKICARWRQWHLVRLCRRCLRRFVHGACPVCWIEGFEFAVLHHALQDTSIQKFSLLDQTLHQHFGRCLCFFLDEANHGQVAFDLDVLAQVQALWWRTQSQLLCHGGFSWLVSAYLPLVPQIDACRGIGVSL